MNNKKKRALALGAGIDQIELIIALQKRAFHVTVVDRDINAKGREYADEFLPIDTNDENSILDLAKNNNFECIGVVSTEQPLLVAAKVSQSLGLSFPLSYYQVLDVTSKSRMKKIMVDKGVPTPAYWFFSNPKEYRELSEKLVFPVIIKPVDSSGSRGVNLLENSISGDALLTESLSYSKTHQCIVEEYIKGKELSIDAVTIEGQSKVILITETTTIKRSSKIGLVTKSVYPGIANNETKKQIDEIVQKISEGLGLVNSLLFVQLIIGTEGIKVLEFCARNAGGSKYKLIKLITGIEIIDLYVSILLKEKIEPIQIAENRGFVNAIFLYSRPGKIASIESLTLMIDNGLIEDYVLYKGPGSIVEDIKDRTDRIGVVFIASNKSEEDLLRKVKLFDEKFKILDDTGNDIFLHGIY